MSKHKSLSYAVTPSIECIYLDLSSLRMIDRLFSETRVEITNQPLFSCPQVMSPRQHGVRFRDSKVYRDIEVTWQVNHPRPVGKSGTNKSRCTLSQS